MQNSYLFYDIETSGLNPCFDQAIQFAAIRTDLEFNEIDRIEIIIKLNPDIIPNPAAMLVNNITPKQLDTGTCEYEAISRIHKLFNTPGTITIGYNNLNFDDEFLRFSFYRNLFTPYTHQYANNCKRMDLYPMVIAYYLFNPNVIVWPKISDKISLKLEHLNTYNQLASGNAHNALTDVEATLKLARLLHKEHKMWDYLMGNFDKNTDSERLSNLTTLFANHKQAVLIDGSIGLTKYFQTPAIDLGIHHHYKNQSLWLPLDSFLIKEYEIEQNPEITFVYRKRFGEPPILLPFFDRFTKYLSSDRLELIGSNLEWIKNNPSLFNDIVYYHKDYKYPEIANIDIDAALYQNGFMSNLDLLLCNQFHTAPLDKKVEFINKINNKNLRLQAIRILARNYPGVLSDELGKEYLDYFYKVKGNEYIVDYRNNKRYTPKEATFGIEKLKQNKELTAKQIDLLNSISMRIQSL